MKPKDPLEGLMKPAKASKKKPPKAAQQGSAAAPKLNTQTTGRGY